MTSVAAALFMWKFLSLPSGNNPSWRAPQPSSRGASNFSTIAINGKRLRLFVDPAGRDGVEFPTAVGPIDILAIDDNEAFYVFELKRASSPDRAIGQVARYMGWVQQTIGKSRAVFGVVVAKSISENLRYAACVVPNVFLFEYEVEFHLHPAQAFTPAGSPG